MGRTKQTKKAAPATKTKQQPKKALVEHQKAAIQLVFKEEQKKDQVCSQTSNSTAQVDSHCAFRDEYEVVVHEDEALSTYMTWSDTRKNHNKFYVAQCLQRKGKTGQSNQAFEYVRYGRMGVDGVKSLCGMAYDSAIKKFKRVTRAKQSKGYTAIKIANQTDQVGQKSADTKAQVQITQQNVSDSKLSEGVQTLMKFFLDEKLMESSLVSVNVDVKRMPLGQLSKETVLQGFTILRNIETAIQSGSKNQFDKLSSDFYTNIPHNFGSKKMSLFVIRTLEQVKEKYDLITALLDIQIASNILKNSEAKPKEEKKSNKKTPNPIDTHFAQLSCEMRVLPASDPAFKMIELYVKRTSNDCPLKIVDCFEISRHGEADKFNPLNLQNKKLLWHGSRFSNFVGILSQGMRIAPPEAPRSGFLFGKGVYFADLIGKSFRYSRPEISGGVGTFVLCEVALGNMRPLLHSDCNADNLPKGFHSTHAVGRLRPKPSESTEIIGDIEVPLGSIQNFAQGGMPVNEFVVYNTNQIKMRYIVRCKRA